MDDYVGDLITGQRFDTQNEDTDAISTSNILRYNQYAQDRLFGRITNGFSWLFEETTVIPLVSGQSDYEISDNLAFGTRITNVEYSQDQSHWYPIQVTEDRYRTLSYSGRPRRWKRRHGTIVVEPTPDSTQGYLRVTYERAMDRLALRIGQVDGTPSGTDIALDNIDTDLTAFLTGNSYICISDINGLPVLYNGVISSFSSPTITLAANVDTYLVDGFTLASLDNCFVTSGKYTTTHSKFPNEARGFFDEYVNRKLNNIEDASQYDLTSDQLTDQEMMIVSAMKMPDKARKVFPVVDHEALILDYD